MDRGVGRGSARVAVGNKPVQQSQAELPLSTINKNILDEALEINTINTVLEKKGHLAGRTAVMLFQYVENPLH